MALKLYLVTASVAGYDDFECGVVCARDGVDAVTIVRAECSAKGISKTPGKWWRINSGATLTATLIQLKRGPVLGHGIAG